MKILIIGSDGFLGTKAFEILSKNNEVVGAGINDDEQFRLDATKKQEVLNFILKQKPDVVIDTVALTSSVKCEQNPDLAKKLNYITAKNISEAARKIGAWMIFMSSSYLFDGKKGNYNEKDETSPINQYAKTKIMAEQEVLKNPKSLILRVDIMYGFNGKNKKNGVFDMILSEKPIELRDVNQIRQPIFVEDVPRISLELIKNNQSGIFHLAGPNRIKMIDFLKSLEKIIRSKSIITSSDSDDKTTLKIPENATLDTSKIEALGIKFTPLEKGLEIMKKQIFNEKI